MNRKRYPAYKPSGIEWIGSLPSHWEVTKVKYLVSKVGSGVTPKGGAEVYQTKGIPLLRSQNVYFDGLRMDDVAYITEDVHRSMAGSSVKAGDVLLNITGGSIGRCYYVDESLGEANVNQHVCIVRKNERVSTKYLYYLLASSAGQQQIDRLQTGANREGLNFEQLRNFVFPLPDVNEQSTLVEYLDEKTALIDITIRKKQRLIELLQKERTALINQAVTHGLDPNVLLKPSGVEWLGDVPGNWEVKRLQFLGTLQNGVSAGAEYFGSGYPFVSYGDVYKNITLPEEVSGMAQSSEEERKRFSVMEGDVFFTRTSETAEEIGLASTCMATIENAVFAGFLIRFRPSAGVLHKGYSKYFFRSSLHRLFFVKEMNLVTRASLSQELLKRLPVVLPPYHEQESIANHLDGFNCKTDTLIIKTEREIELLKEYRTALINEVVTGKRCVVPQPEALATA